MCERIGDHVDWAGGLLAGEMNPLVLLTSADLDSRSILTIILAGDLPPASTFRRRYSSSRRPYEKGTDYSFILRDNQPAPLKTAQQLLPPDLSPSTSADRL